MRKTFAKILKDEKLGTLIDCRTATFDRDADLAACTRKTVELQAMAANLSGPLESNDGKKFFSKLSHVFGRLARLATESDEITESVKKLRSELDILETSVLENCEEIPIIATNVAQPSTSSTPAVNNVISIPSNKQIPVNKWDISFTGDGTGLSVNGFLERVDEYRISRNVTTIELFNSAVELLKGSALIWYRSVRTKMSTWEDFVKMLKAEFEPYDYETELWAEIRARSQGPNERIGNYFACMINLFARLPHAPSEDEKLAVLRRNIAPYFIHHSGLTEIQTVDELVTMCKRLESNKYLADNFQPPVVSRRSLLEPDLACPTKTHTRMCSTETSESNHTTAPLCWNCRKLGHFYRECRLPRNKFCYSCGCVNQTKATCPKCSKRWTKN